MNDKRKIIVEYVYGKFMLKYYKSILEIDKLLDFVKF